MLVVLLTKSNRSRAQRIQLRVHHVAKFGRSDWADYSFADDPSMAEMHFEFRCAPNACYVRSLSEDRATFVNGEETSGEVEVHTGDSIRAGETTFVVNIEGETRPPTEEVDEVNVEPVDGPAAVGVSSLVATCAYLELAKDVQSLSHSTPTAEELIESLVVEEKFLDALRIRAYLLPKRDAVWWGCLCVRDELDEPLEPEQELAVAAAESWVTDPTEELRREAESKSNDVGSKGAGGLLALSAFWCEGTIGPADGPEIPGDDRLVCQGVAAALITAAYLGDAKKANNRLTAFLKKGQAVADGEYQLPSK